MTMRNTFEIMRSAAPYTTKPVGWGAAAIRNNMKRAFVDSETFCGLISQGFAWMPGILVGGLDGTFWRRQNLIGIDFDNTTFVLDDSGKPKRDSTGKVIKLALSPKDDGYISCKGAVSRLAENNIMPVCAYESYSSSPASRRFRIVIRFEEPFVDPKTLLDAIDRILYLFPEADRKCSDLARLFYGTNEGKEVLNLETVFRRYKPASLDDVMRLPERPSPQVKARSYRITSERALNSVDLLAIKTGVDLLSMIQADAGETGWRSGSVVRFHNCPICGHHDCFAFYPKTNSWACFSDSNPTGHSGGSVIDYLMARKGVSYRTAITELAKLNH